MQLTRKGMILAFAAMIGLGLAVYGTFPDSVGGPPLPVSVELTKAPVETPTNSAPNAGGATAAGGQFVTDVLAVTNPNDFDIGRLTVDINGQYLYLQNGPLLAGETLIAPLRMFTDKRSSQRYRPDKYPPEDVVVTGQLPSGARGVTKFDLIENMNAEPQAH